MSEPVFRRWVIVLLPAVAVLSFAAFLVLLVFGEGMAAPPSSGSDASSVSALGHRAFARLLSELGIPVTSCRHDSAGRAGTSSLLIVAEPDLTEDDGSARRLFEGMIDREGTTLVVLPRRAGWDSAEREGFIGASSDGAEQAAQAVLAPIDPSLQVVRSARLGRAFDARDWGPPPQLTESVQLLAPSPERLEPLVTLGDDVLLARVIPGEADDLSVLYVLSDPDLVATHGLVRGDNAMLVATIVDRIRPKGGGVVFDETLHGGDIRPSVWRALFHPPLLFATVSAIVASLLLVAAGLGRFGRARPPPPPIEPGKRFLVEHAAELLRQGGHAGHALERYLAASIRDAGRALHAPASLDAEGLREWLAHVERPDASTSSLEALDARVTDAADGGNVRQVVEAAMAVHAWKEHTTNGSRSDS